ncbi:MAG: hypothetical protein AAGC43_18065, partial [Bacteroidota bacterium]
LQKIKRILFTFLWGSKSEKIKRDTITKNLAEGGLGMVDLDAHIAALKASWVRRQIVSQHPWVRLFSDTISRDHLIWENNCESLCKRSALTENLFWKEVFLSWSSVAKKFPVLEQERLNL